MSLLLLLVFTACHEDNNRFTEADSQLVVEGWIEDGGFPVVILTRSLPVTTDYQESARLNDYLLRWAKVTVSCGTDSVVLTGKFDRGYFPPYIYTTSRMRGEAGKRYDLTVEYRDYHATATTTIPAPPDSCNFYVVKCEDSDTLYQIKAVFTDNPAEKNYYQFFTRVGTTSKQYQASYLGSIDDAVISGKTEVPVYRGHQLAAEKYTPYFTARDTVSVKFAQIDQTSFRIWDSYNKTLSLAGNMFLSTSSDIESNISTGYGYWCGLAAITSHIIIKQ